MSPKTITGEELELDDGPARDAELFLVDGNNLAYRAYFALPEELATSDGMPTNALLGFGNMLFKLLADYKPRGVAVAWDTRPVHRAAVAEAVGAPGCTGPGSPGRSTASKRGAASRCPTSSVSSSRTSGRSSRPSATGT